MSFNNTYFEELLFEKQEGNKSSVLEQWRKTLPGELVFFNCLLVAMQCPGRDRCHLGFRSSGVEKMMPHRRSSVININIDL